MLPCIIRAAASLAFRQAAKERGVGFEWPTRFS
jgi:hypothetical protein